MAQNTCENCHGPAKAHVAAEQGQDKKLQAELRALVRVSKEQVCITCHDGDNDPFFDMKTYWPQIEH